MAISKIILNGVTQIDLTSDTVTSQTLLDDVTAHGADGTVVTGSYVAPTARTSSDVTVNGATVTIPAGAYSSQVQKSVASGTAGTPTATKGSVVNNSISVTPSVTNVTGYITGGTKSGTAVTVTAQEIVAGNTLYCDDSGNWNVANTETFVVQAGTAGIPSASKGSVSNHSISVTPSVTNSEGWISSGTKTGTAVTVSASELVSGNKSITQNGTNIDVTDYETVSVSVSGGNYDADYISLLSRYASPTSLSLPSALNRIGDYAFNNWTSLVSVVMPNTVTSIGSRAFYACNGLTSITFSNSITEIGAYAFYGCKGLDGTLTLPSSITTIQQYAFQNCTNIDSVVCNGAVSGIGSLAFTGSSASNIMTMTSAYFPNAVMTTLNNSFGNTGQNSSNPAIQIVDIGKTSAIGANAFYWCISLSTLILRKTGTICTLSNTNAFTNTPFSGYNGLTGTVYVPNALISTYQTANNWKTLYDAGTVTFSAIEGSIYEL